MKKWIAFLLAAIMLFALCACGASEESLLKKAESIDPFLDKQFLDDMRADAGNPAKVKKEYVGKTIMIPFFPNDVSEDMVEGRVSGYGGAGKYFHPVYFDVYLPQDELASIDYGALWVVGTISGTAEENDHYQLKPAHIVSGKRDLLVVVPYISANESFKQQCEEKEFIVAVAYAENDSFGETEYTVPYDGDHDYVALYDLIVTDEIIKSLEVARAEINSKNKTYEYECFLDISARLINGDLYDVTLNNLTIGERVEHSKKEEKFKVRK